MEKWFYHFTRYTSGAADVVCIGKISSQKPTISSTGYPVIDVKVSKIDFLSGLSPQYVKREGLRLCYPWQIVDSLEEARKMMLKGVLHSVGFGSINHNMEERPF